MSEANSSEFRVYCDARVLVVVGHGVLVRVVVLADVAMLIPLRHHQPRELLAHRLAPSANGGHVVVILQTPVRELRLRAPDVATLHEAQQVRINNSSYPRARSLYEPYSILSHKPTRRVCSPSIREQGRPGLMPQ